MPCATAAKQTGSPRDSFWGTVSVALGSADAAIWLKVISIRCGIDFDVVSRSSVVDAVGSASAFIIT